MNELAMELYHIRLAMSKRSKLTIFLDENLHQLKSPLRSRGFKVITLPKGVSDDYIKELLEGCAILTNNSKDFIDDAYSMDYDILGIEDIKFIDDAQDGKNQTVKIIEQAIRASTISSLKGNFLLRIYNDGKWKLEDLAP
jgi:hypothetical protein